MTFVVLDGAGQVAASTQDVTLQLDTTPPLVQATAGANLTLTVTASDGVSGIDGLSMDGGASWYPVTEMGEGVWGLTFTAAQAYTFAPGTIVARDGAGNLAAYEKEVTLQGSQGRPSGGFSGGGSGSSSSTVATTHATSDTTAVVAYDGVELVVADQPMSSLVMGETELELFLRPDESLLALLGEDYQPAFTATLSNWMEDASNTPDTLVLAVSQEDLAQAEDAAFTWDFNGTVYKKLAASGIDYLVLQVGDQVTALSTAGFAAGVRYTMYRAQGLSSEAFDYHVAMTEEGETTLSVTVAGETWLLTEEEGGAFYYYDVYTGTLEELAQAKGRDEDYALYTSVEKLGPELINENRKMYKGVSPNVDFYSGFVYSMLGIPLELYTPIFAVARIVGWSAHRMEELLNIEKIIRPAYKSIVLQERPYVELKDRK